MAFSVSSSEWFAFGFFGPEAFAEVFVGGVAEDGDDDGFAVGGGFCFGDVEGGGDGCGCGDADEEALGFAEALGHEVGALGGHLDVAVGEGGVVDGRDDGGGHVLEAFEAVEGAVGLHGDALDGGVELAQAAGGAHEGAGGAEAGDEVGDAAVGLLPDFVGGAVVVGEPVVFVAVLVGVEVFFGLGGGEFAGFADGAVGAVGWVGPDDVLRRRRRGCFCARGETLEGMQRVTGKPMAEPSMA